MNVLINSIPKSGTHALARAVELLGIPYLGYLTDEREGDGARIVHLPPGAMDMAGRKHLFIFRDPRNVVLSSLRRTGKPLTQGTIISETRAFQGGRSFYDQARPYLGWFSDPAIHAVRFESLLSDGGVTVAGIAAVLGVMAFDDCYPNIIGPTETYTGKLSDWRNYWTPAIEEVWQAEGGADIQRAFGYG